ncbi:hypothetical protein PAHAL_5G536400 [Panicum hallii]|uniref:Uncharacterized protein n=1 Tax=Panicum hallii TaxID=206008 RepID=A0A2T8IPF8_9POAL|nr:hypothetical protein PAHAL_5G536400 [Panicum hallii]
MSSNSRASTATATPPPGVRLPAATSLLTAAAARVRRLLACPHAPELTAAGRPQPSAAACYSCHRRSAPCNGHLPLVLVAWK